MWSLYCVTRARSNEITSHVIVMRILRGFTKSNISDTPPRPHFRHTPTMSYKKENPFRHRLNLTLLHKLQICVMSVTVAPLRIAAMFVCFMSAWLSATVSLAGHDTTKPMTGWRRFVRGAWWPMRGWWGASTRA